jgi:hypothetical protein
MAPLTRHLPAPQVGHPHKSVTDWLCQLAADHDGPALIVAQTIAGLMAAKPRERVALAYLCRLTGLPSATVNTIVYRMRNRGRLHFNHRGTGPTATFAFSIPTNIPKIEPERVWAEGRSK